MGGYRMHAWVRHEGSIVELCFFRPVVRTDLTTAQAVRAELFNRAETQALADWVCRHVADVFHVVVLPGPTPREVKAQGLRPITATPLSGGRDFIMFSHSVEWRLPFEAWAYVDLDPAHCRVHPWQRRPSLGRNTGRGSAM